VSALIVPARQRWIATGLTSARRARLTPSGCPAIWPARLAETAGLTIAIDPTAPGGAGLSTRL
jgi:hypothetical protein